MKESEQPGGPPAHIFVGLYGEFSGWMPVLSRLRNGLIGTRFILAPDLGSLYFPM